MNIYSISDLHLDMTGTKPMEVFGASWANYTEKITQDWNSKVKDDDIVLVSGDISWAMDLEGFRKDLIFFKNLKGKIVLNRGNHDFWWNSISQVRNALPENMYAVQNDCIRFQNYLICGTRGWDIPEKNAEINAETEKMLTRELGRMEMSLNAMQRLRKEGDIVIYMIHYPPFNTTRQQNEFLNLFEKFKVDTVIYGHLHGKNVRATLYEERNGIRYFLTSCDLIKNKLVQIY